MKKSLFLFFHIIAIFISNAQSPKFKWANGIGVVYTVQGKSVSVDSSGNVYTIGSFQGTVDFDPGSGAFNLTSAGSYDIYLSKLDSTGNFIWAKKIGANSDDIGTNIVVDGENNIYCTGNFSGTVDVDPGSGTFNLIGGGSFLLKMDSSGSFIWARKDVVGGTSASIAIGVFGNIYTARGLFVLKWDSTGNLIWNKQVLVQDIWTLAVDNSENVYYSGTFNTTSDFDPGQGNFYLNPVGKFDIFISKLDSAGKFLWAKSMGGKKDEYPYSIVIDIKNNVYTTGSFMDTVDFDPGSGTFYLTSDTNINNNGNRDIFISKLDSAGNFIWAKRIGGPGGYDVGRSICCDDSCNVYSTGSFFGTVDFNPGSGTFNLTTSGGEQPYILKLDSLGNFVWAKLLGGTNAIGRGRSITLDMVGNIYLIGDFQGTIDFDPGPNSFNLTAIFGGYNAFVLKLQQYVALSCISPKSPTLGSLTINSSSEIKVKWKKISGAIKYKVYYSKSGCSQYSLVDTTSSDSIIVSNLTPSTQYFFVVTSLSNCESAYSICKSATTNPDPSIKITSSIIPPWQRKDDSYDGSVTVSTQNPAGASWHLQIVVNSGTKSDTINYLSIKNSTQKFYSNDPQLDLLDNDVGAELSYFAVLDYNGSVSQIDPSLNNPQGVSSTKIIEEQWNYTNYYYHNNGTNSIKIPIKYDPISPATKVTFKREGKVSYTLSLNLKNFINSTIIKEPDPIVSNDSKAEFYLDVKSGYLILTPSNSNIINVLPGDFKMTIWSGNKEMYSNYFDLTKFGKILPSKAQTNKVVVMIGGVFNETEWSVDSLRKYYALSQTNESSQSYSVATFMEQNGYSSWYIAQGNNNSIARNAYDVGRALDSINLIVKNISEIDLICHSKGGLDARGFLEDYTQSYDKVHFFGVGNTTFSNKIKKIVFLGTPHKGALIAELTELNNIIKDSPGVSDLRHSSTNLFNINILPLKINPKILNLTGYINFHNLSDGVVPVFSSEEPFKGCIQLFQNDPNMYVIPYLLNFLHLRLHQNNILSVEGKCTEQYNNLVKIKEFLLDQPIQSCNRNKNKLSLFALESVLSNATIEYKPFKDSIFSIIGKTDENGHFNSTLLLDNFTGDSIRVSAPGIETYTIGVDSFSALNINLKLAMFHSEVSNSKIQFPSVSIINQNPLTILSNIDLNIEAKNAINYEINSPFNQDSLFKPLNIVNKVANINLDTGFNRIHIRFIGVEDTSILTKEIYYYPDSMMINYSDGFIINTDNKFLGAKLFANNQYYQDIKSNQTKLQILKGTTDLKFSQFGYKDTTYLIDSGGVINLSMAPISYSSVKDSIKYNFLDAGKLNFWKNITTKKMDNTPNTNISIKQYNDSFSNTGLQPLSRTFQFQNLSSSGFPTLKTAICLDQASLISKSNAYLLISYGNKYYKKVEFNDTGLSDYDSIVQKLSYNKIDFDSGRAKLEAFAIMKKLAPLSLNKSINLKSSDSISVPMSSFFIDPDSISNDMSFSILNFNPNLILRMNGRDVVIRTKSGSFGENSFFITATHDGFSVTSEINIKIENSNEISKLENSINKLYVYPNPSNNIITFSFEAQDEIAFNIRIFDLLGESVIDVNGVAVDGKNAKEIEISSLSNGVYLYQVTFGNFKKAGKIIKISD